MPIKTIVSASELPARSGRGISIPEIQEVLNALKNFPKDGGLKVELSPETTKRLTGEDAKKPNNPYHKLAVALKRVFKTEGLGYDAYHSDSSKAVIVVKERK